MSSYFFDKCIFLAFLFFLLGVLYSYFNFNPVFLMGSVDNELSIIEKEHSFFIIFLNNLSVGLLLSLGGYLSGGLLTVSVLFWNGFVLTEIILTSMTLEIGGYFILYSLIFHAPLEIYSFLLLSSIGMKGFRIIKKIILNKDLNSMSFPKYKQFIPPLIILFISAIIESNL